MADPTTLLLIRHGLTDAVAGRMLTGTRPGVPLNSEGRRQAAAVADAIAGIALAAVVSSPLERALETALPIAERRGLAVERMPELLEFEFGEWTGRTFDDLDGDAGWRQFNQVRSVSAPPAGEMMLEVQVRAVRALLALERRFPGAAVAVISHGDVIRAALMHVLGIPLDFVHRLEIAPASVSIVELSDITPRVRLINGDTSSGRL
jgi:probable phosphoglycerate mutase